MADPTPLWPFCPMPGATKDSKLAVDINAFGDGYVHRSTRGLNPVRPSYGVTFMFTGDAEFAAMDSFLTKHAAAGFYYNAPGGRSFRDCRRMVYSIEVKGAAGVVGTLSARFDRSFNPQPLPPP